MPHQCVRCNTFYADGSDVLLKGCNKCGGKFFFFIKQESKKEAEALTKNLSDDDKTQMEKDVKEIIGIENEESPIILDLENIKVIHPGKFELNLVDIFRKKPLVYKLEEGKYYIDVVSTFAAKEIGVEDILSKSEKESNQEKAKEESS